MGRGPASLAGPEAFDGGWPAQAGEAHRADAELVDAPSDTEMGGRVTATEATAIDPAFDAAHRPVGAVGDLLRFGLLCAAVGADDQIFTSTEQSLSAGRPPRTGRT